MIRHAIQTFQMSFAKKPREIPFPEPPEWGHVEVAGEKKKTETRRMEKFLQRQRNRRV